ncbi:MAG: hypothetical protein OEV30_02150 [Ignavibacteria bacterium]|nr:hypothetical protein [Ignavibacteria bacterium]
MIIARRYHLRTLKRKPEEDALLSDALDRLVEMFGGVKGWAITGGVSIALHIGLLYRYHHDIDLLVDQASLQALARQAGRYGYRMNIERWRIPIPPFGMVHRLTVGQPGGLFPVAEAKLYLLSQSLENRYLSWLDLTVCTDWQDPPVGPVISANPAMFGGGFTAAPFSCKGIPIASISHVKRSKERRHKPADRYDLGVINAFLGSQGTPA